MRILIVDDKKENLYLLETLLKGCGYEVVSASNGAEALEKLHTHDFDVIISDILMPVMDGFQLLHEVKKDEKWKGIPFVFYTATYTDKKDEDFALQLGVDMFIRKPMDPDEFIKIIDRMLGEVKKGKIEHKEPTVKGEEDAYKVYSERLVKKLEQKMLDLEKAQEHIEHINSVLKAIRAINQLIIVEKDRDRLLQKACDTLLDARGYDGAWLGFLSDGKNFVTVKGSGFGEAIARFRDDVVGGNHPPCIRNALARAEKLVIVDRSRECEDCVFKNVHRGKEAVIVCLEHAGRLFGLLAVLLAPAIVLDEEEKGLLLEVAGDLALALHGMEVEEARERAEKALQERVKELNCLYGLSKLMETPGISLDEILQGSVDLIPPALRYPEISCARITLDDQEFKTANFQETTWKQSSAITLRGERIGTLDACNLEERPPSDAGPFLKEEISLLDALTERLGKIVDRKRMEEALRESEVRYRTLFEGAAEGVLGADVETKQFKYANPAICKMLGYTEEELKSMGVSDIHPQEDLEWVISEFEAQARSEKTLASALPCLRKDGTVIYVDVNTSPIVVDGRESNVGFFADITDRKQAEEALLESESKYKTLVENIPQKIFLKDKNSVYISCNENYARDLKIKCNEIVGKTDYDFYPKELADKYRANDKRVIESDKEQELEEKYITDGREVWVNTIKTPVKDKNGNVIGVLGIFWDITERKQVEEERELLIKDLEVKHAEMERFAYTISHELKTPLITLRGYTDLLQRDLEQRASEKVATDLSFIDSAADMMARLLEDTLELSRTGRVMNPPEDVPFSALVRDALVQLTEQLKWGRIDVAVAEDLPTVRVDRLRVVEVLVNLMENSIKFMGDQPRPRIEIGSRKEGDEVVFFVKDNGIGLDKSQHEKVFQLFYKVDKESKGSGAGLAIVKRIAEVHGGRIWIESELGKGCTVCFTLPVV
jgi:PAS domain S-box-containing protein